MEILGLEKVSFVDYEDKVCATIFTGGCNFRCPFCHNAGIVTREYLTFSEEYVLNYLQGRKGLLDAVTISGGEPTLQPDLLQFMQKVKDMGYLVKLDTNGTNPAVVSEAIERGIVDLVAVDIKNDFEHYAPITGVSNPNVEAVKKTIEILKSSGLDYELRTTLVAEFHSEENIKKMAEQLKGHKKLYLQKFEQSDNLISSEPMSAVKRAEAEKYAQILRQTISEVFLRGY